MGRRGKDGPAGGGGGGGGSLLSRERLLLLLGVLAAGVIFMSIGATQRAADTAADRTQGAAAETQTETEAETGQPSDASQSLLREYKELLAETKSLLAKQQQHHQQQQGAGHALGPQKEHLRDVLQTQLKEMEQQRQTLQQQQQQQGGHQRKPAVRPERSTKEAASALAAAAAGGGGGGSANAALEQRQPAVRSVAPPPANHHKRHLVIGMAMGILDENLAVFLASLREHSSASVVLFIDVPVSDRATEILDKYHATALEFQANQLTPVFMRKYHPSSYRWPLLYRFVEKYQEDFDKILLIDVRDSAFQRDPFIVVKDGVEGFYTFGGVERITIGQCGWNGGWVRDCFGEAKLARVRDKPIICSGVSLGTTATTLQYLKMMNDIILGQEKFPQCERNGVDQGVHNVLVHEGRIPNLVLKTQRDGLVANLQGGIMQVKGNERLVYNPKGDLAAIVHQYDRNRDLFNYYVNKYRYWGDTAAACEEYTLSKDVDLFKGVCDLRSSGAHDHTGCCSACNRMQGCEGWTFTGGLCFFKNCNRPSTRATLPGGVTGVKK